ncbi:hypothetical protein [Pedosphaera parvula]|uniref:Uncharacterized protein n=1 Tax=Pedosphaera parvula (strain Ellin514) TaxID=320771 RepID=B9XET3_PEDPL|nr:hypothetical protein [Pedosphaera parvula]EEF61797.1 hypothetical protein Cflav_PD4837 [Pedosphaera parvula Ellin514]
MKTDQRGTATIRKRYDAGTAIITVGVLLEEGEFNLRSQFEQPVVLEATPECLALYPKSQALFLCCEGSAQSGVLYATRGFRDQCGCVVFTKFRGAQLPSDCGMGFATAAALACLRALGQPERINQMDMDGWQEI